MGTPSEPRGSELPPPEDTSPWREVSIQRIQILNLVFVGVAAGGSLLIAKDVALGVLVGGALMAANFRIIAGVMRSVFTKTSGGAINIGIYWAKFIGLMVLVGVVIVKFEVDVIGFLVGLSLILIAVTTEAVVRLILK